MGKRKHIIVGSGAVKDARYESNRGGRSILLENKDRQDHSKKIESMMRSALKYSEDNRDALEVDARYRATGSYIEVEVNGNTIRFDSLDTKTGAKLMNVKNEGNDPYITATLFLADSKKGWLDRKLKDYTNQEKDSKKSGLPANANLINSIEKISHTDTAELFTLDEDREKFLLYPDDMSISCEVWVITENGEFNREDFFDRLERIGLEHGKECLPFPETGTIVALVNGPKRNLNKIGAVIDNLSELRLFRQASTLLSADIIEQKRWSDLIESDTTTYNPQTRVGIIDSGVNNKHPLLSRSLPDERCFDMTGAGLSDKRNHGTLLAGLVQYGDLTDVIYRSGPTEVSTDLVSVKTMPGGNERQNEKELYGVITSEAMLTAREVHAEIQCSAVTVADEGHYEEPSSWSGAIDETLYHGGKADMLLFLAAGTIKKTNGVSYPDFNIISGVKDPGQAWNAVTVGAYTEKCLTGDSRYDGLKPLAPKGGLSPYSSTSKSWLNGLVKPEIVMEGGNAIDLDGELDFSDDLILASTSASWSAAWPSKYFAGMYATSAATALAARLAAEIKRNNPTLTALSIRALMIHSAEWTPAMRKQFYCENKSAEIDLLLHTCGYGVPVKEKAVASDDTYVTFIAEREFDFLGEGSNKKYKVNAMQVFDLPWPKEILESAGEEMVKLKVTLSYYIQPAPGSRTRMNKYRYPSIKLRFDVNQPLESENQFISRISHIAQDDAEKSDNDPTRWEIGIKKRDNGSIISDYIKAPAAEIASCNKIAVYATAGWWNSLKYTESKKVKYSLVVSLETERTEIYEEIASKVAVMV